MSGRPAALRSEPPGVRIVRRLVHAKITKKEKATKDTTGPASHGRAERINFLEELERLRRLRPGPVVSLVYPSCPCEAQSPCRTQPPAPRESPSPPPTAATHHPS